MRRSRCGWLAHAGSFFALLFKSASGLWGAAMGAQSYSHTGCAHNTLLTCLLCWPAALPVVLLQGAAD